MCDLNPKVRDQVDAYGLTALIGADRIFETSHALLLAYTEATGTRPGPPADIDDADGDRRLNGS
jgi:hypothetical protein